MTHQQYSLLSKGLSFVPTKTASTNTRQEIRTDLKKYHRRLKLTTYFGPQEIAPSTKTFTNPSEWEPRPDQLKTELLELLIRDGQQLSQLKYTPETPNLSTEEEKALDDLIGARDIVIKPADKGSVVVIMDQEDYKSEALRQLQNTEYYTPLAEPIYTETSKLISQELKKLYQKKFITKKQLRYLQGQSPPRPRYFYLLPKIHKELDKWTVPSRIPPGRPIVSDCGSESYGVAEYLDYFLTPLSKKHSSYIKDTQNFLEKIKALRLKEPCFLFTMDVNSLYTNIDIELGMKATKKILESHPDPSRPDDILMRLLEINLKRNDFVFQKNWYLQTKGTAMGKRFAPAYANIYMADWEETAFQKCKLLPVIYLRFLDDIWGVWTHSKEEFETFVQTLNSHHTSIKIEPQLSEKETNFLDTTVFKGSDFEETGKLDTKLFVKPTDTHSLLHRKSFHPKHVFQGIVKSQLLRYSRICSKNEDYEGARKCLFMALRKRGYSRQLLRSIQKTEHKPKKDNGRKQKVPLIVTYSTFGKRAIRTLKNNFGTTTMAEQLEIIPAYRRNPNLKQLLVRAKLPPTRNTKRTPWRTIWNKRTGFAQELPKHIPKTQTNCVYAIKCTKCQKLYIGETNDSLKDRLTQHRKMIRTNTTTNSPLVEHFHQHGVKNLILQPLEHDPTWTRQERRSREFYWMKRLNTYHPHGLNERKSL